MLFDFLCNSVDAMQDGDDIVVTVGRVNTPARFGSCAKPIEGDFSTLEVCDTGMGNDPVIRDRIVESLVSSRPPGETSGPGLSTAHITMHAIDGHTQTGQGQSGGGYIAALFPVIKAPDNDGTV